MDGSPIHVRADIRAVQYSTVQYCFPPPLLPISPSWQRIASTANAFTMTEFACSLHHHPAVDQRRGSKANNLQPANQQHNSHSSCIIVQRNNAAWLLPACIIVEQNNAAWLLPARGASAQHLHASSLHKHHLDGCHLLLPNAIAASAFYKAHISCVIKSKGSGRGTAAAMNGGCVSVRVLSSVFILWHIP
jgi:hypothetical protein